MIEILRSKKLDQGFNEDQLDRLVNKKFENILLYEIGAKKYSIKNNRKITSEQNKKFNKGLNATIIAILMSFCLLLTNNFINKKYEDNMCENEKTEKKSSENNTEIESEASKSKKRTIPFVTKSERIQLNEGVGSKKNEDGDTELED